MAGEYAVELERIVRAPRALVWAMVADTNRWDRAAGLAAPTYAWSDENGRRVRVARARELGMDLRWVEPPYRWVEGRLVEGERRFTQGPVTGGGFRVELDDVRDDAGATRVRVRTWVVAPWLIGFVQRAKFARALPRYLDAIENWLTSVAPAIAARARAESGSAEAEEPAVVWAKRLESGVFDPIASGPRSPVDQVQLARRIERLRLARVAPGTVDHLVTMLGERSDDELATLRPFEVARAWGVERREALRTFLHATEAGLLDLRWQINCPVCRVGASNASKLEDVGRNAHCDACDIDYGVDFARHVEAVFSPNPSVRRVYPTLYCASSPAFLPHVLAQLAVPKAGTREAGVDLHPGSLHVRTLHAPAARRTADVEIESTPIRLHVRVTNDAVHVHTEPAVDGATTSTIQLVNESDDEAIVLFERSAWSADAALGTAVATFPEFMRLFATDAPRAGIELAIGEVALLFSDLTGSTALYERVGDARAFALVEEHFRLMTAAVEASGGAVVKTMGDAVMASFPTLREAVEAALAMVLAHDTAFATHDLAVKIGIHIGPALVIRANERFDYFGTTVNVAARLQAQAASGELVLHVDAAADPAIAPLVVDLETRLFGAKLKGIAEDQPLVAFDVSSSVRARAADARLIAPSR